MGKRILTGLLGVLLCGLAAAAEAQTMVRVSAERTSVRERAATDAPVVATVSRGEELDVLETSGAWFRVRVRSTSREGFVHNLFVERVGGATAPATGAAPAPAPAPASAPPPPPPAQRQTAQTSAPSSSGSGSDGRTFGVGIASGGLAFGLTPSLRYWASEKLGFEVNASFLNAGGISGSGYSVTAISPSVLIKILEPMQAGPVHFEPYAGGGLTYWRYSNDFNDYYCGLGECDNSSLGFGGFGGVEVSFDAVPKLTTSASVGFYSSPASLGYGGLYLAASAHWFFK